MLDRLRRLIATRDRNAEYDAQTAEVIRRCLAGSGSGVDVGAHAGEILREMVAASPGPHFAFEPIPALADALRRDFPGVAVSCCALAEEAGEAEFVHVVNAPAYSGLRPRVYDRPDPAIERIAVPVRRLDDSVPADADVRLVKIDVEGGEYGVMAGGAGLLARCRPVVVFEAGSKSTSCYGVTPAMIAGVLADCGLRVTTMARWLAGRRDLSPRGFRRAFGRGTDYYFLARP